MNYLSICQELEEVKASIKDYELELERKKTRAKRLEEYKKSIEEGIKPIYIEAKDLIKLNDPIFILLNSELYFKELKNVLLGNYKSLLNNPVTIVQGSWRTFEVESSSSIWKRSMGESKATFHKDLTEDYFAELLLELNKLDNFKIEIEKQELTKIQNNQFSDCTAVGDFDFGALKGITKFKVAKFEKVLQLLNFPKVIEVVNRVQYVFNEKTKEYELKFYKLKEE